MGFLGVIVLISLAVWILAPRGSSISKHAQIAQALVGFHHEWCRNNYQAQAGIPTALDSPGVHAYSAGQYGAYVEYNYNKWGAQWGHGYHILREKTNDTVWTLSEYWRLERPPIHWKLSSSGGSILWVGDVN